MSLTFSNSLSETDALEAACVAANGYHYSALVKLERHQDQGMGSHTFIAKYGDDTEGIIQLRVKHPINISTAQLARTLLGDIVPIVVPLKATKTLYAYGQSKIHGERWHPMTYLSVEDDSALCVQFANILTQCNLHLNSGPVVDAYVVPRLDSLINSMSSACGPFKYISQDLLYACLDRVKLLRYRASNLKVLNLMLCHVDPNALNILIDESCSPPKITGLLDWEQAEFLPFGMNAGEIRLHAVLNVDKHDQVTEAAKPIAIAFWNTLVAEIPKEHKSVVLDSMEIGFILFHFLDESFNIEADLAIRYAELFIERLDWFEEIFRPLCKASSDLA